MPPLRYGYTGLAPYSTDIPPCPKCGHTHTATTYRTVGDCDHENIGTLVGDFPNERLCRRCTNCGYGWDEKTLDT
ncbi:hypothetical protein B4N89_27495 [Embleya scabrispora]|uniref:Uncharacterized protein n=1 Tax=Embleya scabrispora TaxID=159449 RepID=A0A1T3P531_9ACTN|nr:hypothetical protein [Embleya scabrispora]OPC84173.1 hypothetical protein B4N89_27495 [Embleya scabrispora]